MTAPRRLAAILAADVVGYSRMMGEDEAGTAKAVRESREAAGPIVESHGGRIVKTMGDGVLLEFPSVVAAVECAIAIQKLTAERNVGVPDDRRIVYRIGVHLGDVLIDGEDILGDGVNIAARLEGIAEPGGICLSGSAAEHVRGRISANLVDLGEQSLKNIARPVRVYSVQSQAPAQSRLAAPGALTAHEQPADRLALPDKPSIAVLPFQNMSGDPEQEYFADGMVEDIITGLSRIKWLFVIARNSSFIYKGRAVDIRQAGRELGVRYVLEGSVRKAGNRVRITAQLIEAESGAHLWADRYDGAIEDVFDLQDQITDRVVGVVEPSLRQSEIERSRGKRPESLGAYDLYLRALSHVSLLHPKDVQLAAAFLEDALKLDPNYAAAHALLARCREMRYTAGGFDEADKAAALRHAHAVIAAGSDDSTALAIAAAVIAQFDRDFETAQRVIERALSLNPSSAMANFFGARIFSVRGDAARATAHAQRALRLSPFDRMAYEAHGALAMVALRESRFGDVAACYAQAAQVVGYSSFYFLQAIALALADRADEAKPILARGLALEPGFRLRTFAEFGLERATVEKIFAGGRMLGLPA